MVPWEELRDIDGEQWGAHRDTCHSGYTENNQRCESLARALTESRQELLVASVGWTRWRWCSQILGLDNASGGKPPSFVSRLGTGYEKQKEQCWRSVSRFDDPVLLLKIPSVELSLACRYKFPSGHADMEVGIHAKTDLQSAAAISRASADCRTRKTKPLMWQCLFNDRRNQEGDWQFDMWLAREPCLEASQASVWHWETVLGVTSANESWELAVEH